MINASNSLYNYFNQNIREEGQEIEIKISKSGRTYTITDDDIVASSVKITKKSVSGASFDIGECYVDSATFTINKNINNYKSLTGAKVTIRIKVNNPELNLSESVLLGTFRILQDGIKRTNTLLQVTADSYISKFDKSRKRATFTGDLYDLITDSCSKCKVTFGMSESEFRALSPNVAKTYEIKKDSSLKTHRDVIMYVAQLIGGFATTTQSGGLIFKNYTSRNDICNVNDNVIVNYSIGDEVYNLSGLGMSVKENDVYLYREGEDDDSPYFLNLDSNPIMENCTDEEITEIVGNIWGKLIELNLNNFSFEFNGNPLIEVGDIISIPERSLETYVASCEWTYHGKEKISCVSVDKNKRIETQREKQNENKPKDSSKDARVDDLIKNTTTETKKVRKILHTTLNLTTNRIYLSEFDDNATNQQDGISFRKIENIGDSNDNLYFRPRIIIKDSETSENSAFYTDMKGIKAENIRKITIDVSALKKYVIWGLEAENRDWTNINDDEGNSILAHKTYFNIPTIPNSATTVKSRNIEQNWNNISLLKNSIYELDNNGNIGTEYIDISNLYGYSTIISSSNNRRTEVKRELISLQYKTESVLHIFDYTNKFLDINNGNTIEITSKYLNDLYYYDINTDVIRFNFDLPAVLGLYVPTLVTKSMQALEITTNYVNNIYDNSSTIDNSRTNDAYAYIYGSNFTEDTSFNNIIEEKIKELYRVNSLPVTVEYIKEESYTTTIEGTSDKINENTEKTDKNENEIETLKSDVKKNKTNIDKLKQQVKSVTNKVGTMSNSLGSAKTDIAKLDIRVTNLENSGSSTGGGMTDEQKHQLEQNTTDIRNLKTNVANNTKNISTNKTNIDNLTTRVSNLENSGGSGSGITETERQQIQTNKTNIDNLTTRVTNLENSGGSGSGITETERQQIQTNKTNIENLSILVSGHTTSIEDILRRLAILEQGGGGETEDTLKFTSFDIKFNKDKSNASYYFPSFDINNYKIDDTYYISESSSSQLYYYLVASLNKMNSTQTFRSRTSIDSSDFTIIDQETLNIQSSDIQFIYANREFYYDCESSLNDLYAKSNSIHVKTYSWVNATKDTNWVNETTGGKVTAGAHNGDIINLKTTITKGFKALNLENAPSELNKYYYKIIFSSSSTTHDDSNAIIVADWTPLNVEPGVLTDIRFTFNSAWGDKTVNLFISDGQYVIRADYDRIPLLT